MQWKDSITYICSVQRCSHREVSKQLELPSMNLLLLSLHWISFLVIFDYRPNTVRPFRFSGESQKEKFFYTLIHSPNACSIHLCQAIARKLKLNLISNRMIGAKDFIPPLLPPQCIIRILGQNWCSWSSNWDADIGCEHTICGLTQCSTTPLQ